MRRSSCWPGWRSSTLGAGVEPRGLKRSPYLMHHRRHFITLLAAAAIAPLSVHAQTAFDHGYTAWDALLKKHLRWLPDGKQSRANYKGFAADRAALKAVLDSLSAVPKATFDGWSRPQRVPGPARRGLHRHQARSPARRRHAPLPG